MRYNKKRNTAFLFEMLSLHATSCILDGQNDKAKQAKSIILKYFASNKPLGKELKVYNSVLETKMEKREQAGKCVWLAKLEYDGLDKKSLFNEQTKLISEINETFGAAIFDQFTENYRMIGNAHLLFSDRSSIKEKIVAEEMLVENMLASEDNNVAVIEQVDALVLNGFIRKINEHYSGLTESNKQLLSYYTSLNEDTMVDFAIYLNEEIGRIKEALILKSDIDEKIKTSLIGVIESISGFNDETPPSEKDIVTILQLQELING